MTKKNAKNQKNDTTNPAASVAPDALLSFMAKQMGGLDKAQAAFIRDTLAGEVKAGSTFGQIRDKAVSEGWVDTLDSTPVKALFPARIKVRTVKGPKAPGSGRNGALSILRAEILDKLAGAPPMTAADLAVEMGADRKVLTRQLVKLASEGKVMGSGSRRFRTYTLT